MFKALPAPVPAVLKEIGLLALTMISPVFTAPLVSLSNSVPIRLWSIVIKSAFVFPEKSDANNWISKDPPTAATTDSNVRSAAATPEGLHVNQYSMLQNQRHQGFRWRICIIKYKKLHIGQRVCSIVAITGVIIRDRRCATHCVMCSLNLRH